MNNFVYPFNWREAHLLSVPADFAASYQPKQENRLGSEGTHAVLSHAFFNKMDWDQLERGNLAVGSPVLIFVCCVQYERLLLLANPYGHVLRLRSY